MAFRPSLRSRRLEVVGARKNGRARGRLACLPHAPFLSYVHYFQVPDMQATQTWKPYLRPDDVHLHSPFPVFTIWEPGGYSTKGRSRRKFLITKLLIN